MKNRAALLAEVLKALLGGVLFLIMTSLFGPSVYGQYVAVAALVSLITPLCTAGFAWWVQPFARESGLQRVGRAALLIGVLSLCSLGLIIALARFVPDVPMSALVAVAVTEMAIFPVWNSLALALLAVGKNRAYVLLSVLIPAVKLCATAVSVLAFGPNLFLWGVVAGMAGLVGTAATAASFGALSRGGGGPLLNWIKRGLGFGLVGSVSAGSDNVDRILMTNLVDSATLGVYGAAAKLVSFAILPSRAYALASYPDYFVLAANRDATGISVLAKATIRRSLPLAAAAALGVAMGCWVLELWVLRDFRGLGVVGSVLAVSVLFKPVLYAMGDVLYAVGRSNRRLVLTLLSGICNALLILWLVQPFGILGAALAVAIGGLLSTIAFFVAVLLELRFIRSSRTEESL